MVFGHNTNITVEGRLVHVQTEDRGLSRALIDTTVHHAGRVLHRRTKSYSDLLPLDAERERMLKSLLDDQHAAVMDELRSGALKLAFPEAPAAPAMLLKPPVKSNAPAATPAKAITVELLNPRTWLSGKHASLYLVVRMKEGAAAVHAARVTARVEGAVELTEVSTLTHTDGHAQLQFEMPKLVGDEPALAIEASFGEVHAHTRFQLRAKPKVPAQS
jgi:hypothetical protein